MRVVLALDKFKGTLSARQACEFLAEGIRARNPKIEVILRPMADGGEGTAAILSASLGMEALKLTAQDLTGKATEAHIHWQNGRRLALLETAELLGIARVMGKPTNILKTNSAGIGRALLKSLELRPQEVWVGVGGTLTADAGWGLAHILGLRAFDSRGNILDPVLSNVEKIDRMETKEVPALLQRLRVTALCDVNAP
jgi:glycerate 2-kinase